MAIIWSCLALSLLFAEFANHAHEIRAALRSPVRRPSTSSPAATYALESQTP